MNARHTRLIALAATFGAVSTGTSDAVAQCETLAINGTEGQNLGTAIDGDETGTVVAIGAPWFPTTTGAIVVYRDGQLEQTLAPVGAPGVQGDLFGQSVAVSGDRIVGAAPFYRASASDLTFGGVRTYTYDGASWNGEPVLRAAGAALGDQFASVVALDGDRLLADFEPNAGLRRVDVYERQGGAWIKDDELSPPVPEAEPTFARALALQGDEAFVSSGVASDQLEGAVFVYEREDGMWFHVDTLRAPLPAADDDFGAALAVNGDVLLVGAPGSSSPGQGAAYIFRKIGGTWTFEATLTNSSLLFSNATRFGSAVDVAGDVALIGAPRDANSLVGGSAVVFVHDNGVWTRQVKYVSSETDVFDAFGDAVAIAGDAYVGAPEVDGTTFNQGAAYVFGIEPPLSDCDGDGVDDDCAVLVGLVEDCNRNGISDACDIVNGPSTDENGNGVPDECDDCNGNGVPDIDDIDAGTAEDCNLNTTPDACEIDATTPGGPFFCSFGCDPDCNGNGVPDACDVADGTSNDLNRDGVPDECQPDCNGNDVPDDLDVAEGTSEDRNGDGVPDECQSFTACEQGDIVASDGQVLDAFGAAVDVSGSWAVIGADQNDERGAGAGAAYVYRFDGLAWRQETKLAPVDIGPGDRYGWSVAINGDVVVVGSLGLEAIDVYRYDGADWSREQRIDSPTGGNDRFGWAVGVVGDRVIASEPSDDPDGLPSSTGSVAVFVHDMIAGTWDLETTLVPPDGLVGAQFGIDAAIDGSLVVVGAFGDSTGGVLAGGSAHVYRRDGTAWSFEDSLYPALAEAFDGYGGRVDVDAASERAIVGAFGDGTEAKVKASVFAGTKGTWVEEAALAFGDAPTAVGFAGDVLIAGDRAYVGDGLSDISADAGGAVFTFDRELGAWPLADVLLPMSDEFGGQRGASIALGDDRLLLGAPGLAAGRVVDLRLGVADCNHNGRCDDLDVAEGTSRDRNGDGLPDECPLADLNGDGIVGFADLRQLLAAWGPCDMCREDLDRSGAVGFFDLTTLLNAWGKTLGDP